MPLITPIPAFDDNYIWLIRDPGSDIAAVVDPGDEDPVLETLDREGLTLGAILITHKHGDHVGGVMDLRRAFPNALVYGPAGEPIQGITHPLKTGDLVKPHGIDVEYRVMDVPGHTEGHIAYHGAGALFCGDTLFAAGCGRVFSGTHRQLHDSLQAIAALPPDTRVYCAHEYTIANLSFAREVEPYNQELERRLEKALAARTKGHPTVPSTIAEELETNPFLRCGQSAVIAAAENKSGLDVPTEVDVFTIIRSWKDGWQG